MWSDRRSGHRVAGGCGAAQAALQDRELAGNGQTDAFYDSALDSTWLRNANVGGQKNRNSAVS
jgi:hypothetical protein